MSDLAPSAYLLLVAQERAFIGEGRLLEKGVLVFFLDKNMRA